MIKLTVDNCFAHDVGLLIKCDNWEELEKQILDDYEKARKWDYLTEHGLTNEQVKQELTLVELIEKRIEHLSKQRIPSAEHGIKKNSPIHQELVKHWKWEIRDYEKLLEESKQ